MRMKIVITVARDARSGRFITQEEARRFPGRTVVETFERWKKPRRKR